MKASSIVVAMLVAALAILSFFLMHSLFADEKLSGFAVELLAAGVAVVLVVVSVGVTIHFQNRAEIEREYLVHVFECKMKEYTKFLELTSKTDDDGQIDSMEIESIRNQARVIAMLAQGDLLIHLADFVNNLGKTETLHGNGSKTGTFQRVIKSMRNDLGVVDFGVEEDREAEVNHAIDRMVFRKASTRSTQG